MYRKDIRTYYAITFRFSGKQKATVFSADMVLEGHHSDTEIREIAEEVAREKLQQFFADVLPDEALRYLEDPEEVIAIPMHTFVAELKEFV